MEVSRLAIATWASHTWVFDSTNFLPPMRPRSRESGQDSFADQLPFELGQRRGRNSSSGWRARKFAAEGTQKLSSLRTGGPTGSQETTSKTT